MTADVELLQAEIEARRAEVAAWRELSDRMEAVLDQLQAEIERLRAEVEGWKEQHARDSAELRRICQHRDEYKARADRLAEALRDAADDIDAGVPPEDVAAHLRVRADLLRDQEEGQ